MCHILKVIIVAVVLNVTLAKVLPDYINVCQQWTSECLKERMQEAIPSFTKGVEALGIRSLDPLTDDHVSLELPGAFKVELINGKVTGLRKCIVEDVQYANDMVDLTLRCNVTIKGKYKANGQILIVSINGEGDSKIKTTDIVIKAKIHFEDRVRDGVVYYEIKDSKITHNYGEKVQFSLTNLFKGNKELSDAVLLFLNQNWKQVAQEFGGPIFERLIDMIFGTVKEFFRQVPKAELSA